MDLSMKTSRRARRIRLAVGPGGRVVVTRPEGVSVRVAELFVSQKAAWLARAIARMKEVPVPIVLPRAMYARARRTARALVTRRLSELNQAYGFSYNKIFIKNQKTRWGSCSSSGNLSFNYRIALLPPALADYVIAHELCHIKELNHSPRFWALVGRVINQPKKLRAQLRQYRTH